MLTGLVKIIFGIVLIALGVWLARKDIENHRATMNEIAQELEQIKYKKVILLIVDLLRPRSVFGAIIVIIVGILFLWQGIGNVFLVSSTF